MKYAIISLYVVALSMILGACAGRATLASNGDDVFTTAHGHTVAFTFYKHASFLITVDNDFRIQVDPVSSLPPATDYTVMPKANVILVTHEHYDHFDKEAIKELSDSATLLVMNASCASKMGQGRVLLNGDTMKLASDIAVKAVPAYNTTAAHAQFHPKGRDNGYVLDIDGLVIYIAGDTECIPEMKQLHDIDIAMLPCNQPYTMTPQQLAQAARILKPKVLYPYHYNDTPVSEIARLLKGTGIDVRLRHMK